MDVTPLVRKGQQIIQGYAGGVFKISGQSFSEPVIVFPAGTVAWDGVSGFEALNLDNFSSLIVQKEDIDVVLLGCGPQMAFLNQTLKRALKDAGLHVETMDTGAACRTYNVLMAEGRRVAAALIQA